MMQQRIPQEYNGLRRGMCKNIWQPNYSDTKSFKRGYRWRCFCCGKVRKEVKL